MEQLKLSWLKLCLLIPSLVLKGPAIGFPQPHSHSFGKHHLSSFEIITGGPMRLDEERLYDTILLKGDIS